VVDVVFFQLAYKFSSRSRSRLCPCHVIPFTRGLQSCVSSSSNCWGEHGRSVGEDVTGRYSRFFCGGFCRRLAGKQNEKKVLGLAEKAVTGQTRRNTEEARPVMRDKKYHVG